MLVGADRYLSGRLAERRLGATVHLLDDGFQHLELARDVDLLLLAEEDLQDRPMPAGRLREGLDAARSADAALITAGYDTAADRIGRAFGIAPVFRVTRSIGAPRRVGGDRDSVVVPSNSRVFVGHRHRAAGAFHRGHPVGRLGHLRRDRIPRSPPVHRARRAADCRRGQGGRVDDRADDGEGRGAASAPATSASCLIASVPLMVGVEPADAFQRWLLERIDVSRTPHAAPRTPHLAPQP